MEIILKFFQDNILKIMKMPVSTLSSCNDLCLTFPVAYRAINENLSSRYYDEPLYQVKIIDNDYNTYQEVILICMVALGCDYQEGYNIAYTVDHEGSCIVAYAPYTEAEEIAQVIRTIGIEVQVIKHV